LTVIQRGDDASPDNTLSAPLHRLPRHRESADGKAIPQKIKPARNAADHGLVRVLAHA